MGIPEMVEQHLQNIFKTSEGDWIKSDDAFERLCGSWEKKEKLFNDQIGLLDMEDQKDIDKDDPRCMLFLTFSGSLVSLGYGKERWMEYASIKLRTDVPDILRCDLTSLSGPVSYGQPAQFSSGPLKHTSSLYRIVACREDVPPKEQEKRVREATVFLTNSFIHLNRDLTLSLGNRDTEQFTKKNIISYLAKKSGLTREQVTQVTDDYVSMLETGMLMGKKVSFGRLGRFSLSFKPSRKARVGRNPQTGDELTIPAREAHWSPVFKFSASSKEKAAVLPLPETEEE